MKMLAPGYHDLTGLLFTWTTPRLYEALELLEAIRIYSEFLILRQEIDRHISAVKKELSRRTNEYEERFADASQRR